MTRRTAIDAAVALVLVSIGILGFSPILAGDGYLLSGLGGLVLGLALGAASARLRLGPLTTVLAAFVAYALLGTALAFPSRSSLGLLPDLGTLRDLALGAVLGWADLLTVAAPVSTPAHVAAVPLVTGLVAGLVEGVVVFRLLPGRRRTTAGMSVLLIAPCVVLLSTILLGTGAPFLAVPRGVAFAVVAVAWLGLTSGDAPTALTAGRARLGRAGQRRPAPARSRMLAASALVIAAVCAGTLSASALAPSERHVPRDAVQPPFDLREYPSPLSGFRTYTKDLADTALFTVSGIASGDLVRLATLDAYDGHVWDVAGGEGGASGSGVFELTGPRLPEAPLAATAGTRTVTIDVTGYDGVWLPTVGVPEGIDLGAAQTEDIRYNAATATAVLVDGVPAGLEYVLTTGVQVVPSDDVLERTPVADVELPAVATVPDIVAAKAEEYAAGATTPIERLRAIESTLSSTGYLSHGLATDAAVSRSGHGADRMEELFTRAQLVGDQEQFASAMALMARSLGYPARVVMGFEPQEVSEDGTATVTGDDVTAWVEVPFDGVGWVRFFPTPDETEIPQDQDAAPKSSPKPQVRQPPRSDARQDDLLTRPDADDAAAKPDDDAPAVPAWAAWTTGVTGGLLLLYLVPLLVVSAVKRARARRRRRAPSPDARAAGAWDELLDRHAELGFGIPRATRGVVALDLARQRGADASSTAVLERAAHDADEAVFAAGDAPEETIEGLWDAAGAQPREAGRAVGWWRRRLSGFRVARSRTTGRGRTTRESGRGVEEAE